MSHPDNAAFRIVTVRFSPRGVYTPEGDLRVPRPLLLALKALLADLYGNGILPGSVLLRQMMTRLGDDLRAEARTLGADLLRLTNHGLLPLKMEWHDDDPGGGTPLPGLTKNPPDGGFFN